jgi:hypothetical protein
MDMDRHQQLEALAILDDQPWGDMDTDIRSIEAALERALQATASEFPLWEDQGEDRYADEFSVTPEEIETMSPEWKLAYVGRLVRNLALCYGVKTGDFGDQPPLLEADAHSPGGLLRALNDLVMLPTTSGFRG